MASLLLGRRKVSTFAISSIIKGNIEQFQLHTHLKAGTLGCDSFLLRYYSSSGPRKFDFTYQDCGKATKKIDFTDLTRPDLWYPKARQKKRKVVLHMGPTNSGKTYHALKRLESSPSGIYCGPLRLLAWEVAKRLNKANVPCDLITGQERDEIDGAKHKAVTVEMADVSTDYHCAVIDEIQMLGCSTRGFSFTRALLGLSVDELHLCGDPAAVSLIQELLKVTEDDVEVQSYERLLPLVPLNVPLGSFKNIQKGDCVVTFSRKEIYSLKKEIEHVGKHLCSVVYGSLPPVTRTKQASRFNDASSEFDVLVASDAIGMGLNLNISRIIFSTMKKFDGFERRNLTVSEIKQIAGRAGRYGSKFPVGEVTCLDADDLPLLHESLKSPSACLERAGLFPTFELIFMYSRLHPKHGLHQILEYFVENAKLSDYYFISNCENMLKVAAVLDGLPLGLNDKYIFCMSPVDMDDDISSQGLVQFASTYAKKRLVHLKEIFTHGSLKVPKSQVALKELESIHKFSVGGIFPRSGAGSLTEGSVQFAHRGIFGAIGLAEAERKKFNCT
ncbi:hypothetical protein ACFE04_007142 [Oxalis oulophora]